MDKTTQRKLNLLVHLANIDGKFHKSEKKFIQEFVADKGLNVNDFHMIKSDLDHDLSLIEDKCELIFLAIKLIQADQVIDKKELQFCRDMALKLGYKPAIIDAYAEASFTRAEFDIDVENWLI